MQNIKKTIPNGPALDLKIDFSQWFQKIISNWWIFLIGFVLIIPAGQIYLRYTIPEYSSQAKLLIKGTGNTNSLSEASILTEGLGINTDGKDMDNEIQILKSRPVITRVVERLNANVTIFRQGLVKNTELYGMSPIILNYFELSSDKRQFQFYLKVNFDKSFEFRMDQETEGEVYSFGDRFKNSFGEFEIAQNLEEKIFAGVYKVKVANTQDVANSYKNKLQIEVVGKQGASGILELKLIDQSPEKAKDFINTLIEVYNEDQIFENTLVFKNTIEFINKRIVSLTSELNGIESDIERFKSENEIISKTAGASLDYNLIELRSSLGKLSSYEIEKDVLNSLEENLRNNENDLIPSNISSTNAALGSLINEYNSLFLERKKLLKSVSTENSMVKDHDARLTDIRELLIMTIKSVKENLEIPTERARKEINNLKKNVSEIPSVEKRLLEKLRMQVIKENLFLFLLQKKEETELSNAITTANTRIIESALVPRFPLFPQKKLVLIGSILLAFFLPLIFILIRVLLETKIDTEESITSITSVPIIGRISRNKSKTKKFLDSKGRTMQAEMFKLLRTNLNYTNLDKKQQVIAITSASTGEGKSVTAINLALTISFSGKKVVIIDMDLRKPKVASYLGVGNEGGVTTFLTGKKDLSQVLNKVDGNEFCHFISSGPVPPNPTELIMSERMKELVSQLEKEFDYIIMDSPPIGVVPDALLLREFITNTLYIVRNNHTKKRSLKYLEELYEKKELVSPFIVVNDIKIQRNGSSYKGYVSNYGSDYYLNDN